MWNFFWDHWIKVSQSLRFPLFLHHFFLKDVIDHSKKSVGIMWALMENYSTIFPPSQHISNVDPHTKTMNHTQIQVCDEGNKQKIRKIQVLFILTNRQCNIRDCISSITVQKCPMAKKFVEGNLYHVDTERQNGCLGKNLLSKCIYVD